MSQVSRSASPCKNILKRVIVMSWAWLWCDLQNLAGTPTDKASPVRIAYMWRCACSPTPELAAACVAVSNIARLLDKGNARKPCVYMTSIKCP